MNIIRNRKIKAKNKEEDAKKLRQDYPQLAKKYYKDNLVVAKNKNKTKIVYPVICEGKGKVLLSDKENIIIKDSPEDFYQLPLIIESNFKDIFSIHNTSTIYNNINIRVKEMSLNENKLFLSTERTTYYNSLVTNRASDYEITKNLSVRELFETGPKMTSLKKSKLSNHLGFNGFIESSDGYIVFIRRSNNVSIGKNTYGNSVSASVKSKYALNEEEIFEYEGLKNTIYYEILDELCIKPEDVDSETFSIIAIYRDCVECGKPQLLLYAKSTLTAQQITKNFIIQYNKNVLCKKKNTKLSEKEKKELNVITDGSKLVWIHKDTLINEIIYENNGIKVDENNTQEGFVCFDNGKKEKSNIKQLNMVPSASAAVYMLKEYLEKV